MDVRSNIDCAPCIQQSEEQRREALVGSDRGDCGCEKHLPRHENIGNGSEADSGRAPTERYSDRGARDLFGGSHFVREGCWSRDESFGIGKQLSPTELQAQKRDIALDASFEIHSQFGWSDPPRDLMRKVQAERFRSVQGWVGSCLLQEIGAQLSRCKVEAAVRKSLTSRLSLGIL